MDDISPSEAGLVLIVSMLGVQQPLFAPYKMGKENKTHTICMENLGLILDPIICLLHNIVTYSSFSFYYYTSL